MPIYYQLHKDQQRLSALENELQCFNRDYGSYSSFRKTLRKNNSGREEILYRIRETIHMTRNL